MHLTPYLKAGVARVRRALHLRQGLCVILGGVGLGKSSLLRLVASNYETDQNCSACYLHDSRKCKTPFDLLKIMSEDFHVPAKRSQLAHINELEGFFLDNYQCGRITVVFIDEAQRLSLDSIELIRSMLNYESDEHKLVQFVLAGQLDLQEKLLSRRYEMFRSRIVANIELQPLDQAEMESMIHTRLEGWEIKENPFTPSALQTMHTLSGGIPRTALLLCQHSCDRLAQGGPLPRLVEPADIELAYRELQLARDAEVA